MEHFPPAVFARTAAAADLICTNGFMAVFVDAISVRLDSALETVIAEGEQPLLRDCAGDFHCHLTPELSRTAARNGGVVQVTMQPSREAVSA